MRKKLVVAFIVIFVLIIGGLSLKAVSNPQGNLAAAGSPAIGVIEIDGPIVGSNTVSLVDSGGVSAADIMAVIREAGERKDIKAVVLRINSPGGTSASSQEIGIELDRLRENGKPVVTSMGDVCASGGYWLACSSDHIMANGTSLTGSIGVIMQLTNLEELYGKLGVKTQTIKSGVHKDIGSPSRELTAEERELLQDIIDDSYEQFLDQVKKGRKGKIEEDKLISIADGRIFSGRQALELGLVDSLGNYYDAIRQAEKMAGLKKGARVEVLNKTGFWDKFTLDVVAADLFLQNSIPQIR